MSTLLEKAFEKIIALPPDEQDAIAAEILASLADEEAGKKRFAEERNIIREEDQRDETLPLSDLL